MATTKKSRTAKQGLNKRPKFVFRWWMIIVLVGLISVTGLLILRFSRASENNSILLKPSDSNVQVCTYDPAVLGLRLCRGGFVETADGKAWRTSVNEIGGNQWYGPYEKLTAWPDSSSKSVQACVTYRDNVPYGVSAQFEFDIAYEGGTKILGTPKKIDGQSNAFKTASNGLTIQCISASLVSTGFPADYNQVEYRIKMIRGSIDIFQMARTLSGTITSNMIVPSQTSSTPCPVGSVDGGDTKVFGQNRVDNGKTIHLCKIDNVYVNLSITQNLINMRAAAANAGISLPMVIGYRSFDEQVALRQQNCYGANVYTAPASACSPPTAIPGTSNHGLGEAIDFSDATGARLSWLKQNAAKYGFYNLPSEPWHWSLTGR